MVLETQYTHFDQIKQLLILQTTSILKIFLNVSGRTRISVQLSTLQTTQCELKEYLIVLKIELNQKEITLNKGKEKLENISSLHFYINSHGNLLYHCESSFIVLY